MQHLTNVTHVRDTIFFKAWRLEGGKLRFQRKRLSKNNPAKQVPELLALVTEGSIPMVKLLRDKYGWSISSCKQYLQKYNLWSPDWPNWRAIN